MKAARLLALVLLVALPSDSKADSKFSLKEGDRVVFYGDSITDQRLYTTFVETYAVTRFPKANMTFVHSGWGGDRVTGGGGGPVDVRLDRDVTAYKPTVVTIMLGMNDASYQPFREPIFETYSRGYKHMVEKLKADDPGVRLTLIKPSPYDDVTRKPNFEDGYNAVLIRYGDFVHELADKSGAEFADLNTLVVEATKKAFASNPDLAVKLNQDRIHPGSGGQLLMAYALLKAWNAPSTVANATLEVQEGSIKANGENTAISGVEAAPDGTITWTQLDEALPFPINQADAPTELAVRSSDIIDGLDREMLKVVGLKGEKYALVVDGGEINTFTKDQLASGVNLATYVTPMSKQASAVHDLTLKRSKIHNVRWRDVQVPFASIAKTPEFARAIESLDTIDADTRAEQIAAAQPKPHRFELKPKS